MTLRAQGHGLLRGICGSFQSGDQPAVGQILHQDSTGLFLSSATDQQFIVTIVKVLAQFLYDLGFARCRKIQRSDCALDLL